VRDVATNDPHARVALIGETEHDDREVMVEGVSGLLAVHRNDERPQWLPSRRRLEWPGGAVAEIFSAEDRKVCEDRRAGVLKEVARILSRK
jgi:phage terminase large subunit-like protein